VAVHDDRLPDAVARHRRDGVRDVVRERLRVGRARAVELAVVAADAHRNRRQDDGVVAVHGVRERLGSQVVGAERKRGAVLLDAPGREDGDLRVRERLGRRGRRVLGEQVHASADGWPALSFQGEGLAS
jgi:hypothetical protein